MNNKKFGIESFGQAARYWALACAIVGMWPGMGLARVQGVWDTTALTRIDVTAIAAPGLKPEHIVDISDGTYTFANNGQFRAFTINGKWQQKKNQYTVAIDKAGLERQFKEALQANEPAIVIHQLTLRSRNLTGCENVALIDESR